MHASAPVLTRYARNVHCAIKRQRTVSVLERSLVVTGRDDLYTQDDKVTM